MVRTCVGDVTPLLEEAVYREHYDKVPKNRKEKADGLHFRKDQALSIGAWILYMQMIKTYALPYNSVFNLSHSGKYVLCSIEDNGGTGEKVGCDIEMVRKSYRDIARRFFCPSEVDYIEQQNGEAERREAFFRYWVLKESFMKATRLGMGLEMNGFEIQFDSENHPVLVRQPEDIIGNYVYQEYTVSDKMVKIAVCSTDVVFADLEWYYF